MSEKIVQVTHRGSADCRTTRATGCGRLDGVPAPRQGTNGPRTASRQFAGATFATVDRFQSDPWADDPCASAGEGWPRWKPPPPLGLRRRVARRPGRRAAIRTVTNGDSELLATIAGAVLGALTAPGPAGGPPAGISLRVRRLPRKDVYTVLRGFGSRGFLIAVAYHHCAVERRRDRCPATAFYFISVTGASLSPGLRSMVARTPRSPSSTFATATDLLAELAGIRLSTRKRRIELRSAETDGGGAAERLACRISRDRTPTGGRAAGTGRLRSRRAAGQARHRHRPSTAPE